MIYKAPRLTSLQSIQREDIYPTKEGPVRVRASGRNFYVTKPQRRGNEDAALKEFLAAHFLKIWQLDVPDFAIIQVQDNHIPNELTGVLKNHKFDQPAFGSRLRVNVDHANRMLRFASTYQVSLADMNKELMQIALFDLWLKNDDRNENNLNLLYSFPPNSRFVPIDHGKLFDFGRPGEPLSLQTEQDSLISTSLFSAFVSATQRKNAGRGSENKEAFLSRVALIETNLDHVVSDIPKEWLNDIPDLIGDLRRTIFAGDWLNRVWNEYLQHLQATK